MENPISPANSKKFFLVLFILLNTLPAQPIEISEQDSILNKAETETVSNELKPPKWHEFITNIPADLLKYLDITFRNNKILMYSGVAVSTGILIATDDETYAEGTRVYNRNQFNKNMSDLFTEIGDGRTQFALSFLFAGYGLIFDDVRALRTGSQISEAVLASGLVVQVLKHVTGRESPRSRTTPTGIWRFFPNQVDYHKSVSKYDAFPSGHLTTSIATLEVIAVNYPDSWWIRPMGYSICAAIAFGMVNKGIHWHSDYPLAIALGYSFGQIVSHPEGINDIFGIDKEDVEISVLPYALPNGLGIDFSVTF